MLFFCSFVCFDTFRGTESVDRDRRNEIITTHITCVSFYRVFLLLWLETTNMGLTCYLRTAEWPLTKVVFNIFVRLFWFSFLEKMLSTVVSSTTVINCGGWDSSFYSPAAISFFFGGGGWWWGQVNEEKERCVEEEPFSRVQMCIRRPENAMENGWKKEGKALSSADLCVYFPIRLLLLCWLAGEAKKVSDVTRPGNVTACWQLTET